MNSLVVMKEGVQSCKVLLCVISFATGLKKVIWHDFIGGMFCFQMDNNNVTHKIQG